METFCAQEAKFCNVKAGGTSTYHNALKIQASRLLDLNGVRNISKKVVEAVTCT
jgi:hypothetical protein